ncbi:MAG: efflux RND transporter periplasmic adaptor subunit, partial [Pseudomonadales bacterium]
MTDRMLIAGLFAIGITVWLISGEFGTDTLVAEEATTESRKAEIALVRGIESVADTRKLFLEVRGQTRANRTVQLRAEVAGRIEEIPGEKGTHVKEGDVLCRIAIDTRQTELDEARADLKSAQLEYDGVLDLQDRGLQSEINVARAKAALESSRAQAKRAELALLKTRIVAPFNGVVDSQPVEVGDFLGIGQVCVTLMEIDPMLVVGQVAEKRIGQVHLEDEAEVTLITGDKLTGRVTFIGRVPDATTRTYPVEVTVDEPGDMIRAGLTAQMKVPVGTERAHLISPASLVLNDAGVIGVRIVDAENTVRFMPVKIVSEGVNGVWVNGLPERVRLITVGQEEVFDGQVVRMDLSP